MDWLKSNKLIALIVLVVGGTVLAEFPGIEHWLLQLAEGHPHLAVLAEGIAGVIMILLAGWKAKNGTHIPGVVPPAQPQTPSGSMGGGKR